MKRLLVLMLSLVFVSYLFGCSSGGDDNGDTSNDYADTSNDYGDTNNDYGDTSNDGNTTSPTATISSPTDGIQYDNGDDITFIGSAYDSEDGDLTGSSLIWTSDIDGDFGTGTTLTINTLSPGTHTIRLIATDSDGLSGTDIVSVMIIYTIPLPDTGQTTSYTTIFGEDSDYTINPQSYSKLDASGNDLADSATEWAMVRDNVTGLIWEAKTDDGGIHDKDNVYTWYDPDADYPGTPGDGTDTQDFIDELNAENYGGHSDWRLPTRMELAMLVNADENDTSINETYFPNTMSSYYWSSTTSAYNSDHAWRVGFSYGYVNGAHDKSGSYYLRAVRGGQLLQANLIDNSDGTVTDTSTGLMWQQDEAGSMNWADALTYCENLSLAGYDDWRLPNRNELQSIVDDGEHDPAIDIVFFPGAEWSYYWSSTTCTYYSDFAWHVGFGLGAVYDYYKSNSSYVRAVRGGQ